MNKDEARKIAVEPVAVYFNKPGFKLVVIDGECTIGFRYKSETFLDSELFIFPVLVTPDQAARFMTCARDRRNFNKLGEELFGQPATITVMDRWHTPEFYHIYDSLASLIGSRFTSRHAFRLVHLVNVGKDTFDRDRLTLLEAVLMKLHHLVVHARCLQKLAEADALKEKGFVRTPKLWRGTVNPVKRTDERRHSEADPYNHQTDAMTLALLSSANVNRQAETGETSNPSHSTSYRSASNDVSPSHSGSDSASSTGGDNGSNSD